MNKAISTLNTAVIALALSGGAYAQSDNALASPTIMSSAANAPSGYGTPGATHPDGGMGAGSQDLRPQKSTIDSSTSGTIAYGSNNTLARPSVVSPAARK